jgi:hypothetical protein
MPEVTEYILAVFFQTEELAILKKAAAYFAKSMK